MKKLILIFITSVIALGAVFGAACTKPVNNEGWQDAERSDTETPVKTTEDAFISDGSSEYRIVKPENGSSMISFAADEMQLFLEKSTGVKLEIVTDAGLTLTAESKYISLGNTALFESSGVSAAATSVSGYVIKTVNKSIFINSTGANGVVQGVYGFLRTAFGYEFYAATEYKINSVRSMNLPDLDITHNPGIAVTQGAEYSLESDKTYMRRTGMMGKHDIWMMAGGSNEGWCHNTFLWVPPSKYNNPNVPETYHPEWYSPDGMELCFTRDGGDNDDEMFQLILSEMKELILKSDEKVMFSLTQNDTNAWCHCSSCEAERRKYNSNLAIMIKYANRLIREIDAWREENGIEREVKLAIFAYQETMDPPTVKNADGTYSPVSPDVVCEKNIVIEFAPLRMVQNASFKSESNKSFSEIFYQLKALTDNVGIWWYGCYFHTFLIPLNNFEGLQETVQFFVENGAYWSFEESHETSRSTGFEPLRIFLLYKLYDDPYADFDALIDEFFENYYKESAPSMRKLFESWRKLTTYDRDELDMSGDVGAENLRAKYFPYRTLAEWMEYIDAAYAAIEKYSDDASMYAEMYDRICRDTVFVRYLMLELYTAYFDDATLYEMRVAFKKDCTRLGIVQGGSSVGYLSALYASWGV